MNVAPENLVPIAKDLMERKRCYLAAITGLDQGAEASEIEVLYQFCRFADTLTLRIRLPRQAPSIPSIADLFPVANFFEREVMEMFGITVTGTPDAGHLFLPDGWPENSYPLRKDWNQAEQFNLPEGENPPLPLAVAEQKLVPAGENKFIVPIGPQHPALKEPGHFEFIVDGEVVKEARMRLGYVHRGIEKATELQNYVQDLYLLERVCGICSHTHALAYCLGVERLAGVEASPRAQVIREIFAGLERIHSHLLWLGVAAHEAGFDTLFMYSWRDREIVMDLLETISGNRVNYSVNVLGGVKLDLEAQHIDAIQRGLDTMEGRIRHYLEVVSTDLLFLSRTKGIGMMTKDEAELFGLLGPTARASGVTLDVRLDAPYGALRAFPISLVIEHDGDLAARFRVRLRELFVTCNHIRTMLDHLPVGDLVVRMPRKIPAGETVSRVEAPRGELFYFIKSNGTDKPDRVKVRTPSLCNWTAVLNKAPGSQLADVPLLIAGMDPCFSCNDRMVTLRKMDGSPLTWSWEELRQHGIEYYRQRRNNP
jgi:NADH-quinone oxidoreductase subunit D